MAAVFGVPCSLLTRSPTSAHDALSVGLSPSSEPRRVLPVAKPPGRAAVHLEGGAPHSGETLGPVPEDAVRLDGGAPHSGETPGLAPEDAVHLDGGKMPELAPEDLDGPEPPEDTVCLDGGPAPQDAVHLNGGETPGGPAPEDAVHLNGGETPGGPAPEDAVHLNGGETPGGPAPEDAVHLNGGEMPGGPAPEDAVHLNGGETPGGPAPEDAVHLNGGEMPGGPAPEDAVHLNGGEMPGGPAPEDAVHLNGGETPEDGAIHLDCGGAYTEPPPSTPRIDVDLSGVDVRISVADDAAPSIDLFWALSYNSLKRLAKLVGVPATGSKAVLVERTAKAAYSGPLTGFEQLADWYAQERD
jgi:hypothetical protein